MAFRLETMLTFLPILLLLDTSLAFQIRSVFQYSSMVYQMTNRLPEAYDNYGCWCANNTIGKPVDETDVCCFIRSQCYQDVSRTYSACNPKTAVYGAQFNDGKIKCIDNCDSCTRDTCQCDKRAAECFKRHTLTYNATYNRIDNKQYCRSSSAGQTVRCSPNTTVLYNGRCYYLDGSGGHCAPGYGRAPQATLAVIAQQFVNKTYYSQVSNNCCVWTSDPLPNYRMEDKACNAIGLFTRGPGIGVQGCSNATFPSSRQLTFCGSL